MTRTFKAELLKLRRRRVAIAVAVGALAFAAIATTAVFLSATDTGAPGSARGATVASLGQAGGATEAFSIGASFIGILVLVLFIANFAGELTQGTFRTLLMRQPRRIGLLAGKMTALLAFAALVLGPHRDPDRGRVDRDRTDAGHLHRVVVRDRRPRRGRGRLRDCSARRRRVGVVGHGARGLRAIDPDRAGHRDRMVGPLRAPPRRTHGLPPAEWFPGTAAGSARRRRHG